MTKSPGSQRRGARPQSARGKKQVELCYKRIGEIVQVQRGESGVTQQQIADKLGWSRASVANLEAGRQRVMLHYLPRLAKILGVSILQFFDPDWFL